MRWYRDLYLGPNAAQNIQKIREKAAKGSPMLGVYYVTLPAAEKNLLHIFHNGMLKQPLFAEHQCTDVVGVAEGKQEALRLVETIIRKIYKETGGLKIRTYFKEEDFIEV